MNNSRVIIFGSVGQQPRYKLVHCCYIVCFASFILFCPSFRLTANIISYKEQTFCYVESRCRFHTVSGPFLFQRNLKNAKTLLVDPIKRDQLEDRYMTYSSNGARDRLSIVFAKKAEVEKRSISVNCYNEG